MGASIGARKGGHSKRFRPVAEINVTPMVDVMLVLLIVFMVAAPLMTTGVPIDLPQVSSTKLEEKPLVISVAIDSVGKVHVDGVAMDKTAMAPAPFAAATFVRYSSMARP
jgi:biopolymer transport protein TolR